MNASPLRLPDAASIEAVLADLVPASADDDFVPALARAFPGFEFSMARIDDDYWRDTRSVFRLDGSRLGKLRPWMIQIAVGCASEWRAGPIVNPDYRSFDEGELFDPNRIRRVESTDADRRKGPDYRLLDRAGGALVHLRSFRGRCDRIEYERREAERPELERRVIQEIGPDGARETRSSKPCPTGLRTCRACCASSKTGSDPAHAHSGCPRIGRSIFGITPTRESGRSASFPGRCGRPGSGFCRCRAPPCTS